MILYIRILNVRHHIRGKIASWVTVRGEGGVAGEGRVVGVPKFHSWGKCTMPLTNINSDWMSNASSGLWINLHFYIVLYCIIYAGPLFRILGCNVFLKNGLWRTCQSVSHKNIQTGKIRLAHTITISVNIIHLSNISEIIHHRWEHVVRIWW